MSLVAWLGLGLGLGVFIKLYVFFYIMLEMDTIIFHDNWDLCMLLNARGDVHVSASTLVIAFRSRCLD
jgi:hypothetical protein